MRTATLIVLLVGSAAIAGDAVTLETREGATVFLASPRNGKVIAVQAGGHIPVCGSPMRLKQWLKNQPEVTSVQEGGSGDFSFFVKKAPSGMGIHCD